MSGVPVPSVPGEVKVTLLLLSGQYLTQLCSDDPLLQRLFEIVQARARGQALPAEVLHIPLEGERSLLSLPSQHLVGIITEPPVWYGSVPPAATPALGPGSELRVAQYTQIKHFLTRTELEKLLAYVEQQTDNFVDSTTSAAAEHSDYRQSKLLNVFPEFSELVTRRVRAILPDVFRRLTLEPFSIGDIEAQLTVHHDGHYYKIHNDSGSPDALTRSLTYVYYFYREPKAFSGGELVLYDTQVFGDRDDNCQPGPHSLTVEPLNNSIVFFPSYFLHEVLPVRCPSRDFLDGRFTINGWVRRALA